MRIIIITIIGSLISMNLVGQNLDRHNWENRILIVKTEDEQSKKFQEQLFEFRDSSKEFKERKLVLYRIVKEKYELTDYGNIGNQESGELNQNLIEGLLNTEEKFEIILIGLDGRVKLQQTDILTKEELFQIIDSMPMRKVELKKSR